MQTIPLTPAGPVFDAETCRLFAASYPESPQKLSHRLRTNPLLSLEAIVLLAESLPEKSVHYNKGDLSIGGEGERQSSACSIGEAIRNVETSGSWAVLKNIEQAPEYAALLREVLAELRPLIEQRTGRLLHIEGWIFVSSPNAVTPFHFDPEHNILMQLNGRKEMTVFPASHTLYAADEAHEAFHTSGKYELSWSEVLAAGGETYSLAPGEALLVPVKAPHYVRNGPAPSISLSITWRSQWSFDEGDARIFNRFLRHFGFAPAPPRRWPQSNRAKAWAWRILRRLGAGETDSPAKP
jgi:hypothetical protein